MKTKIIFIVLFACVMASAPLVAGKHKGGQKCQKSAQYDPATAEELSGSIVAIGVAKHICGGKEKKEVTIEIQTSKETITVQIGPENFIKKKFGLEKGDTVEISGSRVRVDSKEKIIARKIKKAGTELILRKEDGAPLWNHDKKK